MVFKWFIALKKNNNELFNFKYDKLIHAPKGRYYADPFVYKYNGLNYIFFEDYDYKKGVISCISIDANLNVSKPIKVLEERFHLSYPFIFDYQDNLYLIPEAAKSNKIILYKCNSFPNKWEKIHTIINNISARDTTLHFDEKGIYLLTSIIKKDNYGFNRYFQIYHSNHLFDKFCLIKSIKDNSNSLRNGGKIFKYKNKLYRISQQVKDGIYGRQFTIKNIISIENFKEIDYKTVKSDWHSEIIGTHTYNFNEDLIVWDGKLLLDK